MQKRNDLRLLNYILIKNWTQIKRILKKAGHRSIIEDIY